MKPFRKIVSSDQNLMRVQDAVAESLSQLTQQPLLDVKILRNVQVSTASTFVDHGLGRTPLGFLVIDKTANVDVWRSPTPSPAPTKLLALQSSSPATISLLVF